MDDGGKGRSETTDNRTEKVLGDFRIIRLLGRGGMGSVYEAEQLSLHRKVALKVLAPHLNLCEEAVLKFRREAEAGGRQSHPGIAAIYAVGEWRNTHYIAQELVESGVNLAEKLEEFRGGEAPSSQYYRDAALLAQKIALALQHAHDRGVVHRDIKPSNIMLTCEGDPKVTDFGLAKVEDALALSRTGDFAGTPYYMSPEQAASRRIGIDHRTDIFSLGVTLYEMLTLKRPFQGETSREVLEKILLHEPRDPRRVNPRVPGDLAVICLKAMEKRPADRYPTMAAMAEDLDRFLSGRVILARPSTPLKKIAKKIRQRPAAAAAVLSAPFILLLLFLLVKNFQETREEMATLKAENERLVALQKIFSGSWNDRPEWTDTGFSNLYQDEDGKSVIYVVGEAPADQEPEEVLRAARENARAEVAARLKTLHSSMAPVFKPRSIDPPTEPEALEHAIEKIEARAEVIDKYLDPKKENGFVLMKLELKDDDFIELMDQAGKR